MKPPAPNKENVAFTRYADRVEDKSVHHLYQFPRGQPYRIINNSALFKIQKPKEHWENIRRSKSFLAKKFFSPFDIKEGNLRELLINQKEVYENAEKNPEQYE